MPTLPSIEVTVTLRLAFDVSDPFEGVGANKEAFTVVSCTGDGTMRLGDETIQLHRFQVSKFKRGDVDALYNRMLTLRRGDKVRFSMALEARPYQVMSGGKQRDRWALQPGQPYSLKVLEGAVSETVDG